MEHEWYLLLPIALFGIFYLTMCAYLVFHTFLSMGGDLYFSENNVSKARNDNGLNNNIFNSKADFYQFIYTYFYNDERIYDRYGRFSDLSVESERLLDSELSDSDEISLELNRLSPDS